MACRSKLWAYACVLSACSGAPEGTLDSDQLRSAQCAGLAEDECSASDGCRAIYADPNGGYSGCEPGDPLDCSNVSCPPGYQCIDGIAGPVCVSACSDPNGCACVAGDGVAHAPGASFPAPDGCNTCTCDPSGQVICTEIACPCPLDFICPDGSQPSGPNCECPSHGCCDDVACPPGHHCVAGAGGPECVPDCDANDPTDPNGCVCPAIVCPDGTTPLPPDCSCAPPISCANVLCAPGTTCVETSAGPQCVPDCDPANGDACGCPLDFVCPDGTLPVGPSCECGSTCDPSTGVACECPLDFLCADGSVPVGPNCECPATCDPAAGQACGCVTADGTTVPPGSTFMAPDGCNVCVCGSDGQIACTEIACGN